MRRPYHKEELIEVMPVKLALLMCITATFGGVMGRGSETFMAERLETDSRANALLVFVPVGLAFGLVALMMRVFAGIMKDLQQLPMQLDTFRIQDALSTCCSLQHVHPETGEEMPCDRELVPLI